MADYSLSVTEVAARLGVSRDTVLRLVAKGSLPALRVGQQWRVSEEDLTLYIEENLNGVSTLTPVIFFYETA